MLFTLASSDLNITPAVGSYPCARPHSPLQLRPCHVAVQRLKGLFLALTDDRTAWLVYLDPDWRKSALYDPLVPVPLCDVAVHSLEAGGRSQVGKNCVASLASLFSLPLNHLAPAGAAPAA